MRYNPKYDHSKGLIYLACIASIGGLLINDNTFALELLP